MKEGIYHPGFTMADIVDPSRKIVKLRERQACIQDEIAVLQDRHELIEHEIAQLGGAP